MKLDNITISILDMLGESNKTLSVAESITGGAIAAEFVKYSGASNVFKAGVVAYSDEAKIDFWVYQEMSFKRTQQSLKKKRQ